MNAGGRGEDFTFTLATGFGFDLGFTTGLVVGLAFGLTAGVVAAASPARRMAVPR